MILRLNLLALLLFSQSTFAHWSLSSEVVHMGEHVFLGLVLLMPVIAFFAYKKLKQTK